MSSGAHDSAAEEDFYCEQRDPPQPAAAEGKTVTEDRVQENEKDGTKNDYYDDADDDDDDGEEFSYSNSSYAGRGPTNQVSPVASATSRILDRDDLFLLGVIDRG